MKHRRGMLTPELSKIFKGVSALPTTFVIDPEGKIRQRHEGERCARLALTTKDENGDVKLAGEAVIAI